MEDSKKTGSVVGSSIPRFLDFTPTIDLVDDSLYLGDLAAATNPALLDSLRVERIVTIDIEPLPSAIIKSARYTCMYIYAMDREDADLLTHFMSAIDFILEGIQDGKIVLVHCYFGVSRSATIVCSYIMKKYHLNVEDALNKLKEKRRVVSPNTGFLYQLELFFQMNWVLDDNNYHYRLYKLQSVARRAQLDKSYGLAMESAKSDEEISPSICSYKCRICRNVLFTEKSVILHTRKKIVDWRSRIPSENLCEQAYLLYPLPWMDEPKHAAEGRLTCHWCDSKLGSFNWKGAICACEAKIEPYFFIPKEKVDECKPIKLRTNK